MNANLLDHYPLSRNQFPSRQILGSQIQHQHPPCGMWGCSIYVLPMAMKWLDELPNHDSKYTPIFVFPRLQPSTIDPSDQWPNTDRERFAGIRIYRMFPGALFPTHFSLDCIPEWQFDRNPNQQPHNLKMRGKIMKTLSNKVTYLKAVRRCTRTQQHIRAYIRVQTSSHNCRIGNILPPSPTNSISQPKALNWKVLSSHLLFLQSIERSSSIWSHRISPPSTMYRLCPCSDPVAVIPNFFHGTPKSLGIWCQRSYRERHGKCRWSAEVSNYTNALFPVLLFAALRTASSSFTENRTMDWPLIPITFFHQTAIYFRSQTFWITFYEYICKQKRIAEKLFCINF